MSRREWKIVGAFVIVRARTSSLKSNRDPLPRFYCQAGNHSPQGNVDLHRFQHGGLPTLRLTLVGQFVSIALVPMRKGSSLIALDQRGGCSRGSGHTAIGRSCAAWLWWRRERTPVLTASAMLKPGQHPRDDKSQC